MACKRKRSVTTEKPLSFSPWPMQIILLSLGILKLPELCLAFSPPSTYHSPTSYAQKISISTHGRRPTTARLYAFPKSSDTSQQTENQPFYAQDVDSNGQGNNYHGDDFMMNGGTNNDNVMESATNGNSGGMDAYAQQMQEFTKTTSQEEQPPLQQQTEEFTPSSTSESSNNNSNSEPISSVDARVLESILQDGKLDLSSEYEVKKLLEGPRLQEGEDYPSPTDDEKDGKFSSKFVSTVSDNTFWNSLRAKASEVIDSVGIYIENRIERDSKTLAAVGIFTLDRIRKDIGRALPAAGRATRKLLLATNSSYAETFLDVTDRTPFALPAERSLTDREMLDGYDDMYDELTTPADEIRSVTEAIRDILSGKEIDYDKSSSRRGVRSFAPAGTSRLAERQRRAYKARKETVLKREKEGIDRKLGRALGSVSDATWEFRREIQTDKGREAGYRSKGVRKALASGATALLEAGRESSRRLLQGEKRRNMIGGGSVEIVDDSVGPNNFVDVSPMEEEEIIENVIEETNMEYAPDGLLSPQSFIEEKRRLISSLESCLSQPSETWLTKDAVSQAAEYGINLDGNVLREVITNMVTLRDQLQREMEQIVTEQVDLKIEFVAQDLRRMKQRVDELSSLAISAAGESAANMLKQELEGFVLSDSIDDIIDIELERMEQLLAEMVAARENEIQARKQQYQQQVVVEPERYVDTTSAAEVIDSTASRGNTAKKNGKWNGGMFTEVEVVSSDSTYYSNTASQDGQGQESSNRVEVISDTEYSDYEQQFKSAQSVAMGDDVEANENQENPAADLVLRIVDVIFFVGEKFFFVLLPDLITGGAKVSSRYAQAQNRGRGSVGWKPLKNIKTKNIR